MTSVGFYEGQTEGMPFALLLQLEHDLANVSIDEVEEYFSYIGQLRDRILEAKVYLRIIEVYHERCEYEKIINFFEPLILFIDEIRDPILREKLYFYLIHALWYKDQHADIVYLFHGRIEFMHQIEDIERRAKIYRMLIDAYIACNRYEDVITLYTSPHMECLDDLEQNRKNETIKRHLRCMFHKARKEKFQR